MKLIDTHAHIYHNQFNGDLEQILESCFDKGVERIYMPNIDEASIPSMLQLHQKYPDNCFPMLGIHPCDVAEDTPQVLDRLRSKYRDVIFKAVGETGLDLYWDKSKIELQIRSLNYHLQWALDESLPIVLHTRDAMQETIDIVSPFAEKGLKGIFHCFNGDLAQAQTITSFGFLLGIGGVLTFKNSGLDAVIKEIDIKHLVLETDSPFLAPVPYRGKRNSPEYLPIIATKLAEIKNCTLEEIAIETSKNAFNLFESYPVA